MKTLRMTMLSLSAALALFAADTPAAPPAKATFETKLTAYWQATAIAENLRAQYAETVGAAQRLQTQAGDQVRAVQAALDELQKSCTENGKVLAGLDKAPFKAECVDKPKAEAPAGK